jgi:hypothetical protein
MEALGRPRFRRAGLLDSCCGSWFTSSLELDRREHAKRGVSTLAIMEDLEVFEDRVGELYAGPPAFAVNLTIRNNRSPYYTEYGGIEMAAY